MNRFVKLRLLIVVVLLLTMSQSAAHASKSLSLKVNRFVEGYYSASSSVVVGSKLKSSMARSSIQKFCGKYRYFGIHGASGRQLAFKRVNYAGKVEKSGWKKNSDGEDELSLTIRCEYSSVFKNLPNSNWYVFELLEIENQIGGLVSHRMPSRDIEKSNWRVELKVDVNNREIWTPSFTFPTPVIKSLGCVDWAGQSRARVELNDTLYFESSYTSSGPSEIKYFLEPKSSLSEITNFPQNDELPDGFEGWGDAINYQMDFAKANADQTYSKVAFIYGESSSTKTVFTIVLEFGPDCRVTRVINLGKTK